jgi:hypothetical protein
VREVLASHHPKGEQKSNRYTLQIEITATPTKQTAGTRANRYNLSIRRGSTSRAEQRDPGDPSPLVPHKLRPIFSPGPKF